MSVKVVPVAGSNMKVPGKSKLTQQRWNQGHSIQLVGHLLSGECFAIADVRHVFKQR